MGRDVALAVREFKLWRKSGTGGAPRVALDGQRISGIIAQPLIDVHVNPQSSRETAKDVPHLGRRTYRKKVGLFHSYVSKAIAVS